jgi:hypothetical protein
MGEKTFKYDQAVIDDAIRRIQQAAQYVAHVGWRVPRDPVRLGMLRQQVEELRVGLIVMTGVADDLQQLHDKEAASMKELAWAVRPTPRSRSR